MAIFLLILWAIIHQFWKPFGMNQIWWFGMLMFWTGIISSAIECQIIHKKSVKNLAEIFNKYATIMRSKLEELQEHRITEYLNTRFAKLRETPNSKRELICGMLCELDDIVSHYEIVNDDKNVVMIRSKAYELYAKLDEDLII